MALNQRPSILIFGATGTIGSALIRELLANPGREPLKIRAAVRRQDTAEALRQQGVEPVFLDLDGVERLPLVENQPLLDAMTGIDRLFLLTGYSVDMLAQSKAIIDAAKISGVDHVVHMGAHSTDDTTIVHLGWHQFIERYIEWTKIPYTHLRPNTFMQNVLRFALQADGAIYQSIGNVPVSWIDTDDIARAAAAILRTPQVHVGKTYSLAVESRTFTEVAERLSDIVGKTMYSRYLPPDDWLAAALQGGMEPAYATCVRNVFVRTAQGMLDGVADISPDFKNITGKEPTLWSDHAATYRDQYLQRIKGKGT